MKSARTFIVFFCLILFKLERSGHIFEEYSSIKLHENPSKLEPSCSVRTDGQTDMTKIIVTFRNFTKTPKNRAPTNTVMNCGFRKVAGSCSSSRLTLSNILLQSIRWNAKYCVITSCFSDRASLIDYILITNLMHWLLFIHKILFSSTCFEAQVLIFRRILLYTCSIWYCHSLREFVLACR